MLKRIAEGTYKLLIDGQYVAAASGRSFDTVNPATGKVIAQAAEADAADVDAAVRAARAAFEGAWGQMKASDRGALLLRLADLIRRDEEELIQIESLDSGKPVATILPFKDEEDALRIANGTVYNLAAGVWTSDITRAHRFTRRLKAGTVWVNTYGPTDICLPWGGARDSGFGPEHGDAAIDNFTEPKAVWINTGA